ncbi:MAG: cytochrome c [Cytophagales bacterium]|nr:cytochrome c [Cytophagales bacterium]
MKFYAFVFLACCLIVGTVHAQEKPKPWTVPESAKKVKMPIKNNAENLSIGKGVYAKHCKSCHGKNGEGDGPKASELKTFPGDFSETEFQKLSEAELFYKTAEGRDDMPSFKKKIGNDEDIWAVVQYIKTFKK